MKRINYHSANCLHYLVENETTFYEVKTICQLFEEQAENTPDQIALEYNTIQLSYQALNAKANKLARYLRARYQDINGCELPTNTPIPICSERSPAYIIGILAILKAGAAYVPISSEYPISRVEYILNDTNSRWMLVDETAAKKFQETLPSIHPIRLDETDYIHEKESNLEIPMNSHDLAYVIYTSGSTGIPKGVEVRHVNVVAQTKCATYFNPKPSDTFAFFSDTAFDSTTVEIWGSLLNGAKLYIPENLFELLSSPQKMRHMMHEKKITILELTRSLFDLLYTSDETIFKTLNYLLIGGEALTKNLILKLLHSPYKPKHLVNCYGPTENNTFCIVNDIEKDFSELNSVPIGRPYSNRIGYVLDKHQQLMPIGILGELYVGGPSLAKGYLNKPELTLERFMTNPFHSAYSRVYRTNDLVRWLPEGQLEFGGRNDFQVKLRGYRIELGEIESKILSFPAIKQTAVLLKQNEKSSYLVCYYVAAQRLDETAIREHLTDLLPSYMVPSMFVHLTKLPVTTNGKLDQKALPEPSFAEEITHDKEDTVKQAIAAIWSTLLNISHFSPTESFFHLGGNSIAAMHVRRALEDKFKISLNIVKLFEYTSLNALSEYVSSIINPTRNKDSLTKTNLSSINEPASDHESIAIVGMACRLPGIKDIESYWNLLLSESSNLRDISTDELRSNHIDEAFIADKSYVKRGAIFNNAFTFDADFFGYSAKEAELMDPQQRQFLECSWEALEHSGNVPEKFDGDIGVFASQGRNYYFIDHVYQNEQGSPDINIFQAMLGNEKDFLSTRVSFKLNLTGPSVTLQTACSSSLVSIQMACESLKTRACDMALAGGVSLFYNHGYSYRENMIESPDGFCRAFDEKAKGTVVTSGMGIVVLKRLSDAIKAKDQIYAVIKGGAINNDGAAKMGYTAPSVKGQSAVIEKALKNARVSPQMIRYVEAHGTGTTVGDPIEWTALHQVYEKYRSEEAPCTIGAVKTNIGHTDAAAGVMGLMKAALALKHKTLPATLHFKTLHPEIASFNKIFTVSNKTMPWEESNEKRYAAISSFGIGGTNAHVILEEYPEKLKQENTDTTENTFVLIPFSAKNQESLLALQSQWITFIETHPEFALDDIAFTAQEGRAEFPVRSYLIVEQAFDRRIIHLGNNRRPQEVNHSPISPLTLLTNIADLWLAGAPVRWESIRNNTYCQKCPIPTYSFMRKHYEIPKKGKTEALKNNLSQTTMLNNTTKTDEQLKSIWAKALGINIDELSATSHFFNLGGDSLTLIELLDYINKTFFLTISLDEILETQAFDEMLTLISAKLPQQINQQNRCENVVTE